MPSVSAVYSPPAPDATSTRGGRPDDRSAERREAPAVESDSVSISPEARQLLKAESADKPRDETAGEYSDTATEDEQEVELEDTGREKLAPELRPQEFPQPVEVPELRPAVPPEPYNPFEDAAKNALLRTEPDS